MPSISIPSKQRISIDPYTSKLFDFDNRSSRVYLSRTINNLLRVFGTDIVIDGLNVSCRYINDPDVGIMTPDYSEKIIINITSGKCIIDTTLIEIDEDTVLDIEVSSLDDAGKLLLFLSYKYSESIYENQAGFKLIYLDKTAKTTTPKIDSSMDRLLLSVLTFNKAANMIQVQDTLTSINIADKSFEVRPYDNFKKAAKQYVRNLFS
jgi:hypothetical protein